MSITAMKQALEALESAYPKDVIVDARAALRAAISEQEKCEPQYFGLTAQHTWLSVSKEQYEKLRESYRCVFFTHPAPVPAGWRLVPVEPTEKQWAEGKIVLEAMFDCGTSIDLGLIYKAMLQAAPKPGENHE
jgi:hypothetical protein